jgi:methylenetetrahydrofolate dehydrogenase (NADP+)/methenyltetrahydrofolate cyclohydrolase
MKILNGSEIAGFIKEGHSKRVAATKAFGIVPKLAIIHTNHNPVVDTYMNLKSAYGQDIGAIVDVRRINQADIITEITKLNKDKTVMGIIVQIPLPDPSQTDEALNAVAPEKDVDGLRQNSPFDAPTPTAINWLLSGYNIDLPGRQIVIVGQGRLVGKPLADMWLKSELKVKTADKNTEHLAELVRTADILITATGRPGLIKSDMVKTGAIVVDAGTSTDTNGLAGDVAPEVRQRDDITITPESGGVGPLTVCALFDNVIRAAERIN